MKLHTVMVTFNRLECTKQSIASFLETVTVPYSLCVVDNGSSDGTQEWLQDLHTEWYCAQEPHRAVLFEDNWYPGFACNRGWDLAPDDATHLQRADNDWSFLEGWCDVVAEAFESPEVGQVGLRTQKEEPVIYNVGGNNIIRRELWDAGLRYDERPWTELPAGHSEDTYLSPAVEAMGFVWHRVAKSCIVGNSDESNARNEPYYQASYRARRIYGFK